MNEQRDTHETAGRSAAPSIEARALTRSFGDEVDAVRGIDLSVGERGPRSAARHASMPGYP
jgi:hypothetical protein